MARSPRYVFPGCPHHVTQRGVRKMQTFHRTEDYELYLALLRRNLRAAHVDLWSHNLMPNHVHLILVPSTVDGLSIAMREAHRSYAHAVNKRMGWKGHLWQERFYSCPMSRLHLYRCLRYVANNPVRAGLVSDPFLWPWSAAGALRDGRDPTGLVAPAAFGLVSDWSRFLRRDVPEDQREQIVSHSMSGEPLGSREFRDEARRWSA